MPQTSRTAPPSTRTSPEDFLPGEPGAPTTWLGRAVAFYELTKPGIVSFIMVSAGVGYYMAAVAGDGVGFGPLIHAVVGTGIATGGALALNQYAERDADRVMRRTRDRPIPSGRVTPREALVFGLTLLGAGITHLAVASGALPALLAAVSGAIYLLVYTPLKRRSPICTIIGAAPGALPILIGWAAGSGSLDPGGWVLFGIVYLWQLPHVLALGHMYRDDFERAGFRMIPVADPAGRRTGRHMLLHTAGLLPVSILPAVLGMADAIFFFGALALGVVFLALVAPAVRGLSNPRARKVFFYTLIYLPTVLTLLVVDASAV